MNTMNSLTTGQLAQQAEVNVETLRFYERKGLLPEPPRRVSGYREYPRESVRLIRFIKRAQELGFTLNEIRELLSLRVRQGTPCAEVQDRARQKLQDTQQKIADLQAISEALKKLIASCKGRSPASQCPILEHLGNLEYLDLEHPGEAERNHA